MDQLLRCIIRFDRLEAGDAGQAAEDLRRTLQDEAPGVEARRVRTDPEAMDLGGALEVTLAAPAIVVLARGVAAWLERSFTSEVTITLPNGTTLVVKGISARQASDLAGEIARRLRAALGL